MKNVWIVIAVVLAIGLAAAGGFWGGMQYQISVVEKAQANFENLRGPMGGAPGAGLPEGAMPGGGQLPGGAAGFVGGRGGISGTVKSLEGSTLTLSTAQDVTTVQLTDETVIVMSVTGSLADLQPGVRVLVVGEGADGGEITATRITLVSEDAVFQPLPDATRRAP